MSVAANDEPAADEELVAATLRLNTWIFGAILGTICGFALAGMAVVAGFAEGRFMGLAVALLGVFVPGYGTGWSGALAGLVWGFVVGGVLGAGTYRITMRSALSRVDEFVAYERGGRDFPEAVLRVQGHPLGLAIGVVGALGLIATTNWLVVRGTADESIHARLLAEVLPGYAVSFPGSLVGAAEVFVVLYLVCRLFSFVYTRVADSRRPRG